MLRMTKDVLSDASHEFFTLYKAAMTKTSKGSLLFDAIDIDVSILRKCMR